MSISLSPTYKTAKTSPFFTLLPTLTKGSIVTLNKAAGEPVELYANGKLIAYGEVVVIEESFGIRVTEIIK